AAFAAPSFEGLGDLPGGSTSSVAWGVSGDGSMVVGESEAAAGTQAFAWANGVMVDLPGGANSAYAASTDGRTLVGSNGTRWDDLVERDLNDGTQTRVIFDAFGVTPDGRIAVGRGPAQGSLGDEALIWNEGQIIALGDLAAGGFSSEAYS